MVATALSILTTTANFVGDRSVGIFNYAGRALSHSGGIVANGFLGDVAGRFSSMGPRLGFFQGAVQGSLYSFVLRPMGTYIANHAGEGPDQFNDNARLLLYTVGTVADFAVPVILTAYCGKEVMTFASAYAPGAIVWLIKPGDDAVYSITAGLFLNVVPTLVSFGISLATYVEPRSQPGRR